MYTPNIFGRGELSDAYHGHAYFNSVYNIYQGMPYTHNVTSIYGHYGLFFKIPMELVHGDFKAFVAMVAGIGAFAHICAFLILELLVKSRVLRVLGALAVTFPVLGMRGGFYWQVWPHRVIFPMLLFLYGAWILKKELCNFWTAVGGHLICLLAILWNTETGLILTVAWAGMLISRFLSVGKIKIRRLLWLSFAQFAGMAGAVFGAYGTVNLYNILKHSPANSFEDFLIPLLSGSYMTGVLHLDMPTEPNAYMAVITLFLTGTALGMTGWFSGKERHCWQKEFLFLLSVGSLGCLVYYINRPAYHNLDCITMPAAIMAAYWGQKGIEFIKNEEWKRFDSLSLRHVTVSGVGLICSTSLWYTGAVWNPTRHHTRTGTYQQRITVSMVTSGKFNDFVPSCIASGCTDRTHNCFCTGIYHTYHFHMWKMLTDKFCHFHFNLCSTSKAQAFRTCFYHCLPDFWKIMSKDHWSPGVNIINITVIIYIINMASIRTFDKSRCHSNCTISSYRTVNPSRNSFDRPFK